MRRGGFSGGALLLPLTPPLLPGLLPVRLAALLLALLPLRLPVRPPARLPLRLPVRLPARLPSRLRSVRLSPGNAISSAGKANAKPPTAGAAEDTRELVGVALGGRHGLM